MIKYLMVKLLTVIVMLDASPAWAQHYPSLLDELKLPGNQVVVVSVEEHTDFHAVVSAWEQSTGVWKNVFKDFPAVIGRNGLALEGEKREGDGKTPAGVYGLSLAFGEAATIPTGLNYRQATDNDFWVDDPESPYYNMWVEGPPQAKSFEHMKREDGLYKYGIVIEYNMAAIPGDGSAIFFHIWRGPDNPTAGCVAFSEDNILKLLSWLDIRKNPVVVIRKEEITHAAVYSKTNAY
jgi:L,D-peptidoglycan transpeptidase YkuD (ErfK/YbiS/YcfS/YnhG family)